MHKADIQFDFDAIKYCLSFLDPEKSRVVIVARDISGNFKQRERWYGTEYDCKAFSETLLEVEYHFFC